MLDIQQIKEDFMFLDSWEDRYQYIIDLGEDLPPLDEDEKTDESYVQGCMSNVWIVIDKNADGRLSIRGESDSAIVQGLAAILIAYYSTVPAEELKGADALALFREFNLETHLSPNRRNGLHALNKRIKSA